MRFTLQRALALLAVSGCSGSDLVAPAPDVARPYAALASASARTDAPAIINVTRVGGQATIIWTGVPGSAGYQVVSCGDTPLPTVRTTNATETSWTFTNLEPGAPYGIKVRAWHEAGAPNNGKYSPCVAFVGAEWVAAVEVLPGSAALTMGQSLPFTVRLTDRFGAVLTGRTVTWTSSNPAVATVSTSGLLTAVSPGTIVLTAASEGKSGTAQVRVESPGWSRIAAPDAAPVALTTSVYAEPLDAIFAAEMPDYGTGSLWRFDLATSRWTRLTANNWPFGKYRQLAYDPVRHRLLTYWDGLGQVYSIPETGGTWTPDGAADNLDEYYEAYSFFNPASGRLSVFAGYGGGQFRSTLWEWNGSNAWMLMPTNGTVPPPRFGRQTGVAVDAAGGRAFFAQRWMGATPGMCDDLWVMDLRSYTFRNVIPANTGAGARGGSGLTYDPTTGTLYRYGGLTLDMSRMTGDFVAAQPDAPTVRWNAMPASAASPGARYQPGLFHDVRRHRLILVSGLAPTGWASDVWVYPLP